MPKFRKENSSTANKNRAVIKEASKTAVKNFMNGTSFTMGALDTLRMIAASSIFGEPSYYRSNTVTTYNSDYFSKYIVFDNKTASTSELFISAANNALDQDFLGVINLAVTIRKEYNMRLNAALIIVLASVHPNRVAFNKANPNVLRNAIRSTVLRPDDLTNQFDLYVHLNGSKNNLPNVLKREWANQLGGFSRYQIAKYKSKALIDLVRVSHAKGELINELCKTGTVSTTDEEKTWETLRSSGMKWHDIVQTSFIPHMALLRNLRNIFEENTFSNQEKTEVLLRLKSGVLTGKQFPYRYYTAYKIIENLTSITHSDRTMILSALEECIDLAVSNFPKLTGKTISLCDNSGSALGQVTSEYGTTVVAEIANLSGIITALQSDNGEVGVFGNALQVQNVSNRTGILKQLSTINAVGRKQGQDTENGVWLFWQNAINNKIHYDNVFIYSDMQAGRGGLYGLNSSDYRKYCVNGNRIDVLALVLEYRNTVNPKVNVFSVQVAGYDNSILPDYLYRGAMLTGWTGKEVMFAKELIDTWNSAESQNSAANSNNRASSFMKKAPSK